MGTNLFQQLYHADLEKVYKYFIASGGDIILDNIIGDIPDLQVYFENLRKNINNNTRILISYHNPTWEPALIIASKLGLRRKIGIQNWLDQEDLKNILELSGFEVIKSEKRFFGMTTITTARIKNIKSTKASKCSVSIIVPTRNEEGNVPKIIPSLPKFGKSQEIIFVEGGSHDNTWEKICNLKSKIKKNGFITIKAYKQTGKGKANAVKLGFEKATGEILMIYDADRTVMATDLPKFYNALVRGTGEFINGSRLIYPMEKDAMQTLNKIGNKFFGSIFTWILKTKFKDTLCGTKAMFRADFIKYKKDYGKYLKMDPFGDFALIFTAVKHDLKVVEIPVRYKERVYGSTNINRFRHGLILIRMAMTAFREFKV